MLCSADLAKTRDLACQALQYLSPGVREPVAVFMAGSRQPVQEIRLRLNRPLMVETDEAWMLRPDGGVTATTARAWMVGEVDLRGALERMTESSLYTMEEELRRGFITLPGGHRAGLAGECLVREGRLMRIKTVTAINLRLAREIPGIAEGLLPYLWRNGRFCRTLIVSPPKAGKTTVLRDLIRALSDGTTVGCRCKVGLVDERSEVVGCFHGVPQLNIGVQTDVLDGCPKTEGIILLLRTMSPDVVAVDELGSYEEAEALRDLLHAGVSVLATAHAEGMEDLRQRPTLARLVAEGGIERAVVLSRRLGPGTVEGIWDVTSGKPMPAGEFRLNIRKEQVCQEKIGAD